MSPPSFININTYHSYKYKENINPYFLHTNSVFLLISVAIEYLVPNSQVPVLLNLYAERFTQKIYESFPIYVIPRAVDFC